MAAAVLADTSAWGWAKRAVDEKPGGWFQEQLDHRTIATCDMVKLELLHSARNPLEFSMIRDDLAELRDCRIDKAQWERALWVYGKLSARGGDFHRAVSHPDLLIAAAAEDAGLPVLHYDSDYELIAELTGQQHIWLAPQGSLG